MTRRKVIELALLACYLSGCNGFKYNFNDGCSTINIKNYVWRIDCPSVILNNPTRLIIDLFSSNVETIYLYPASNSCFKIELYGNIIIVEPKCITVSNVDGDQQFLNFEIEKLRMQIAKDKVRCDIKPKNSSNYSDVLSVKFANKKSQIEILITPKIGEVELLCQYNWYNWSFF